MSLPKPECRGGYTSRQIADLFPSTEHIFWAWMHGQTMMICGGPSDGAGERNCHVAHGGPIVYPWDLERYLAGKPVID